jgi:hypothetical protein
MSTNSELFRFAAKAGSLEGYLFQRDKVEPLADWIGNIDRMYRSLPRSLQQDIKTEFREVLQKALEYGDKVLEPSLRKKLEKLLSDAS